MLKINSKNSIPVKQNKIQNDDIEIEYHERIETQEEEKDLSKRFDKEFENLINSILNPLSTQSASVF